MDSALIQQVYFSILRDNLISINQCIQKGMIINQTYCYEGHNFIPLIYAVKEQSIKVVEYLLQSGAVVLIKSKEGETPLSVAAKKGNLQIVKLLLENGAKPSMQTALLVAIENKRLAIVQCFVENGVFVNWKYKNGDTPLSKSIKMKCVEISKFLIDNGANIEEPGVHNETPLILSLEHQVFDVMKYLLQKGANIDHIDNQGQTALSVAASNKYLHFATYLIESGADIHLAQKAVDEYAESDEDFDIYLKLFKRKELKLTNRDKKEASFLDKESSSGQEEASPLPK